MATESYDSDEPMALDNSQAPFISQSISGSPRSDIDELAESSEEEDDSESVLACDVRSCSEEEDPGTESEVDDDEGRLRFVLE